MPLSPMTVKPAISAFAALIVLFSAPAVPLLAQADNAPVTHGIYRKLQSAVLGEERTLLIRLPDAYERSTQKYPVIYRLDGEKDFFMQTVDASFYLFDMAKAAPDAIVVGIPNTDRNRDLGIDRNADKFIAFLKSELVPFMDKNYRTDGYRIICGQSFSATFVLYAFLKEPALFNGHLMASLFVYDQRLVPILENALKNSMDMKNAGDGRLFLAYGARDAYDRDGSITRRSKQFMETLRKAVPPSVLIESRDYDGEGHVPFHSVYDGLKWIFASR